MWLKFLLFCSIASASVSFRGLPFPEEDFTFAAALTQATYCTGKSNWTTPGLKIGNATLLRSISYGNDVQRVNIYHDDDHGITVAYEGTNASVFSDWAQDVNSGMVNASNVFGLTGHAKIHNGISEQFFLSWNAVKSALNNITATYPQDKILVTGHSMGGGLCQLGALAIENSFKKVDKAIAFAPVKVGDSVFASEFDSIFKTGNLSRYTGVTNGNDWVPYGLVFSPDPEFPYEHPSGMVLIYPESGTNYIYFEDANSSEGPAGLPLKYYTMETLVSGAQGVISAIQAGEPLSGFNSDFFNIFNWGPHEGVYMGTWLAVTANCIPSLETL